MYPYLSTNRRPWLVCYRGCWPLALLLWLFEAGLQPAAATEAPGSSASVVDVPVRLSLVPLTDAAEKTLPYQVGNWQRWKDWHGIETQYRAWRGPLRILAYSDILIVQAHIRYWVRARKDVLGIASLRGECGIDESPRQALIGMQVRLGWGPDWTLRPQFRLLPTRFLDRCEMTIANIDVTPVIEMEFRKQMQNSLRTALSKLAPAVKTVQRQASRTWTLLQEPVALGPDSWLLLRPTGVALSPVVGRGQDVTAHLALVLQPVVVAGTKPDAEPRPLPPLGRYFPRSSGLNLHLSLDLDFATLSRQLSAALAGQSFDLKGRKAGIEKLVLAGSGQEIRARVELSGDLAGTAELRARLAYDAPSQTLELRDLDFDYSAEDVALDLLVDAFYERIRQALESLANQALTKHLALLGERLRTMMRKSMPASVALDLSDLHWQSVDLALVKQGLRLEGTAIGGVQLVLR